MFSFSAKLVSFFFAGLLVIEIMNLKKEIKCRFFSSSCVILQKFVVGSF